MSRWLASSFAQCVNVGCVRFLYIVVLSGALSVAGCAANPPGAVDPERRVQEPGDYLFGFRHGERQRFYRLHIPRGFTHSRHWPVVMVFHSAGGNPALIEERTEMSRKADDEGFIVVYPAGVGIMPERFLSWNSGHCCFVAHTRKTDDVAYVRALLEHLERIVPVDRSRLYATGFSNGGMLVHRLAVALPDTFAAIAPVAATIGGRAADGSAPFRLPEPGTAVPTLIMHGVQDQQVPYSGGEGAKSTQGRSDLSVGESLAFWGAANDCGEHETEKVAPGVERHTYQCKRAPLVHYAILNGGHAWPGEPRANWRLEYTLLDVPTYGISATDVIWAFFEKNRSAGSQADNKTSGGFLSRSRSQPTGAVEAGKSNRP